MLCWASYHPLQLFNKNDDAKSPSQQPTKKPLSHYKTSSSTKFDIPPIHDTSPTHMTKAIKTPSLFLSPSCSSPLKQEHQGTHKPTNLAQKDTIHPNQDFFSQPHPTIQPGSLPADSTITHQPSQPFPFSSTVSQSRQSDKPDLLFTQLVEVALKNNELPDNLEMSAIKLLTREKKRLAYAEKQGHSLIPCSKCHQLYNQQRMSKHVRHKECTVGQFIHKWITASEILREHMLKFTAPELKKYIYEYGHFSNQQQRIRNQELSLQESLSQELNNELGNSKSQPIHIEESPDDIDSDGNPRSKPLVYDTRVREEFTNFRNANLKNKTLLTHSNGLYGTLLESLGEIYKHMNPSSKRPYAVIGRVTVDYHFLQTILKGIRFSKNKISNISLQRLEYCPADAWLEDRHIDCFVFLLEQHNFRNPGHQNNSIPVIIDSHFYPTLLAFSEEAIDRLRVKLNQFGLLSDQGWKVQKLLFPISLENTHWISIFVDCQEHTYWAIDPFRPSQPKQEYLDIGFIITHHLEKEFGLEPFHQKEPIFCKAFPKQIDGFNCGIYLLWYLYILVLEKDLSLPLTFGPDIFRALLITWIIKQKIDPDAIMNDRVLPVQRTR